MKRDLARLFKPKSIAVVGGGAWCASVIEQCKKAAFRGDLWSVHPTAKTVAGLHSYRSVLDLPFAPDACFIGVNRNLTPSIVADLATINAGGAVCFASGFSEAVEEDHRGTNLQTELLNAAGEMPILGPNCYGFINYLDDALLWPDQHGGTPVDSGVAIITQSSNIAINLTMQRRQLPLAYIVTAGNQAQTSLSEIGAHLLADKRVTALGLHIEGFGNLRKFETLAKLARELGKPIIALKSGRSSQARAATQSHTASIAGDDAGAQALLDRLAIPRLKSLPSFLETLKLLHMTGPLTSDRLTSVSCSGGEASLVADTAFGRQISFPPVTEPQKNKLREVLGPLVSLANPLDYHTFIWRDTEAMTKVFSAMMGKSVALTLLVVDFPRSDRCATEDWDCAIEAAIEAKTLTGGNVAMVASLPELMSEKVAERLVRGGVVPLNGLAEAIDASEAAAKLATRSSPAPVCLPGSPVDAVTQDESTAKRELAEFGVCVPISIKADRPSSAGLASKNIGFPVVLKGLGFTHKTEMGAVVLGLQTAGDVEIAARAMQAKKYLVEEMVTDVVAEILVGIVRDPAHGFILTLAAGGVLTELMNDSVSLLVPASRDDVRGALQSLSISKLLAGYRGKPAADIPSIVSAIMSMQDYAIAHSSGLEELEINPLLCGADRAIAADALIRKEPS